MSPDIDRATCAYVDECIKIALWHYDHTTVGEAIDKFFSSMAQNSVTSHVARGDLHLASRVKLEEAGRTGNRELFENTMYNLVL